MSSQFGCACDFRKMTRTDKMRAQLRELSFGIFWKAAAQVLTRDQTEHGIAEEFQLLVVVQGVAVLVRKRAVGQGTCEQCPISELVPEIEWLQCRFLRGTHVSIQLLFGTLRRLHRMLNAFLRRRFRISR